MRPLITAQKLQISRSAQTFLTLRREILVYCAFAERVRHSGRRTARAARHAFNDHRMSSLSSRRNSQRAFLAIKVAGTLKPVTGRCCGRRCIINRHAIRMASLTLLKPLTGKETGNSVATAKLAIPGAFLGSAFSRTIGDPPK